jgi:hypothetical protein
MAGDGATREASSAGTIEATSEAAIPAAAARSAAAE